MNLLKDLREEGKTAPAKEFQEEPFPSIPSEEENLADAGSHTPLSSALPEDETPSYERRKKRSAMPAAIVGIILLAAIILAYFGFFKKGNQGSTSGLPTEKAATDSTALVRNTDSSTVAQGQKTEEETATTITQEHAKLAVLGDVMSAITNAMPPGTRLNSLFLDDGVFSVEIEGSNQNLEKFKANLKAQLPASATLNSSRAISAGKVLVSGTFPVAGVCGANAAPPNPVVRKNLREIASKTGAKVLDLSIGRSLVLRGSKKAPVFVKLSGNYSQIQSFYNDLIQKDWNMQVSKIIIMPAAGGRANLVLRIFLVNQA